MPLIQIVRVGPHPVALAVDQPTGHVFVVSAGPVGPPPAQPLGLLGQPLGPGRVDMLDARTGVVLHTQQIGRNPRSVLAVAHRPGRVFAFTGQTTANGEVRGPARTYVLDARSGRLIHTTNLWMQSLQAAVDEQAAHVFTGNSAYSPATDQTLESVSMLDATTGTQ